jgi:hypothetical protein
VSFLRYILPIGAIGLAVLIAIAAVVLWQRTSRPASITALVVSIMAILLGIWLWNWFHYSPTRAQLEAWVTDPTSHVDLSTFMATPCPGAPFQLPSKGFVGFLYGDKSAPYMPWNPHTGVDIFGDGAPGNVPVYAAYEGYLTRLSSWTSAVIIRIPKDPFNPSRQIWTYYSHMANETGDTSYISSDFPPGTSEKFVTQGTLLGYQGLYNGTADYAISMHVHFSITLSGSNGSFTNETRFYNTIDPSPYFGFNVNADKNPIIPVACDK